MAAKSWLAMAIAGTCAAAPIDFKTASERATAGNKTEGGRKYSEDFQNATAAALVDAMKACISSPDTKEPAEIVFVISAEGKVTQTMSTPGIPYGQCVASKIVMPAAVPRPPQDGWVVGMLLANHSNSKAPVDKPIQTKGEQLAAMDKAIAPYIAKARATYPAAKKRFLAGLPANHIFLVGVRLTQTDATTKQHRVEDVFVTVKSIKKGIIQGVVASNFDILTDHHQGEDISFPESEVRNWVIVRPDGSEEGNYVGKFLDHYQPQ